MHEVGKKRLGKHELKKIVNDVGVARSTAIVVVEIDEKNNIAVFENCPDFSSRLGGTIAVIGPGTVDDIHFERAILLEIGVGPSRPYKQGWISDGMDKKWFSERKKCFSISQDQYLACAPIIFKYLQKIADKRVAQWKCNLDNPFYISGTRKHWSHRGRKMYIDDVIRTKVPAVRFSVSTKDSLILSDIFLAEIEINESMKKSLKGLAGFIDKRLKRNRENHYVDFSKLKAAEDIGKSLMRLPLYLKAEMLERFFGKRQDRNKIYNDLAELIGWDFEKTRERRSADVALPDINERIGDIQIAITSSFQEGKDYIVFEVVARNNASGDD